MARKYLQMGYTRARRYANYKGGRKYDADNNHTLLERGTGEEEKARQHSSFMQSKDAVRNETYAAKKRTGFYLSFKLSNYKLYFVLRLFPFLICPFL